MQFERLISSSEDTLYFYESVKVPLLTGGGGNFMESCKAILDAIGWSSTRWGSDGHSFVLSENAQAQALTLMTTNTGPVRREDMAQLIETVINYWNKQNVELKGILIACTYTDIPIPERREVDFPTSVVDFAKQKQICLISTTQLLYIYRDIKLGKVNAKDVRQAILNCAGCLTGFNA